MIRLPPRSTRTDPTCPSTTLFLSCQDEVTEVRSRLNHRARGDIQLVLGRAGDWRVDPFDNLASGWTDDHAGELRKFGVQISVVDVDVEVSRKGEDLLQFDAA